MSGPTGAADGPPSGVVSAGPDDSPGFLLWRTTLHWQRTMAETLGPLGLTHVQFVLLATVWWLGSDGRGAATLPSQRQVADHAGTDVMMTSQVLRSLERRGLVTRSPDPDDARVRRLAVTAAGSDLAPAAIAAVERADRRFFAPVRDPAALLAVLHALDRSGPTGS